MLLKRLLATVALVCASVASFPACTGEEEIDTGARRCLKEGVEIDCLPGSGVTSAGGSGSTTTTSTGTGGGAGAAGIGGTNPGTGGKGGAIGTGGNAGAGGATTTTSAGGAGGNAPVGCKGNNDCAGNPGGTVCDPKTGDCVACLVKADCKGNLVCDPSTLKCVDCASDQDCPLGQVCSSNKCVAGCNVNHACPGVSDACCNGSCVDINNDNANCGACGTSCTANFACAMGLCGLQCAIGSGLEACGGPPPSFCADTKVDPSHCGSCVDACQAGQVCNAGICTDLQPPPPKCVLGDPCLTGLPGQCSIGKYDQACACVAPVSVKEVCNGLDDDCDGQADNGLNGTACNTGFPGECAVGTLTCANGVGACKMNQLPSAESCNGKDDDCDGIVDNNNPGGGLQCATGLPGACASGKTQCANGASVCLPPAKGVEACNGIDDDCDGQIDNGNPGGGGVCKTLLPGVCNPGILTCANGALGCVANVAPSKEVCNGADDDCNGIIDDKVTDAGGACVTKLLGVCNPGTLQCANGVLGCVGNVAPSKESCNGVDDDCDGVVDNGDPGGGGGCNSGKPGICAAGIMHCQGGSPACVQNAQAVAETCDGFDNDCNGKIDDGNMPGVGAPCGTGKPGVCAVGTIQCQNGTLQCVQTVQPSSETCNGLDDDCNGLTDDGLPGQGQACQTGKLGACAAGINVCFGQAGFKCNQQVQPSPEVCNGVDDNCDGAVDNGDPGGGGGCNSGKLGVCAAGIMHCQGGILACAQNVQPGLETCNGLDDNCDGAVDNGIAGLGQACNTGKLGVCSAGLTACVNGGATCTQQVLASSETCNGLDDNCDGAVDNGPMAGIGAACATGKLGVCNAGLTACVNGAQQCAQQVAASPEVCDGKDNDCNGSTDDGIAGVGTPCNTGKLGACGAGKLLCNGQAVTCTQNVQPVAEFCNALDDNCNGQNDEGNVCLAGQTCTPGQACGTGLFGACSIGVCAADGKSCSQAIGPVAETCNGVDDDCNGQVDDGAKCAGGKSCIAGWCQ